MKNIDIEAIQQQAKIQLELRRMQYEDAKAGGLHEIAYKPLALAMGYLTGCITGLRGQDQAKEDNSG